MIVEVAEAVAEFVRRGSPWYSRELLIVALSEWMRGSPLSGVPKYRREAEAIVYSLAAYGALLPWQMHLDAQGPHISEWAVDWRALDAWVAARALGADD